MAEMFTLNYGRILRSKNTSDTQGLDGLQVKRRLLDEWEGDAEVK